MPDQALHDKAKTPFISLSPAPFEAIQQLKQSIAPLSRAVRAVVAENLQIAGIFLKLGHRPLDVLLAQVAAEIKVEEVFP